MIKPPVVRIRSSTVYRNQRLLPVEAEMLVRVGEAVRPETPIARVLLPAPSVNVPVASNLGVRSNDLAVYLVKQIGDQVRMGDVIARRKATLFQSKRQCRAPIDGIVEYISYDLGHVAIRRPARPTVLLAESMGRVREIVPGQSISFETGADVIQGAFGIGGEVYGQLKLLGDHPAKKITSGELDNSCIDCVLVAGAIDDEAVITRAAALGARGLIIGSLIAADRGKWPVSSGSTPIPVIVTDGFGNQGIFPPAFNLFQRDEGKRVWLRPSRTGRPEIVILLPDETGQEAPSAPSLLTGMQVRLMRPPFAGLSGQIIVLPEAPRILESGICVPVAEVKTSDGRLVCVPVANLELIG